MTSEVLTKLWKYKKQLDAFLRRNEDDKVLTMLQKINKLNVTIEMIQETSIGKLVNSITSKKELGIGTKASALVDKWRRLIEEIVDKKYKSDEEVEEEEVRPAEPPKKIPVQTATPKKSTNHVDKKMETPEKPRQKRKSEPLQERSKPPKQSRTIRDSVTTLSGDEGENKKSFLDALDGRPERRPAPPSSHPSRAVVEPEEEDEDGGSSPGLRGWRSGANGFDLSDEVFEHLERVVSMLEDRKKAQAPKEVERDDIGGRTYAVPNLFCGKRSTDSSKNIPTFVERFQHLLYDNIESIEYIGNVPFEILEPVLRKLNPIQLEKFEHFNPTVVQKSDEIWKMHVLLKYPGRKPAEFGSWREVYLDNRDAMKAKLEQSVQKFSTNVAKMKREEHKTKFFDPCMSRIGKKSYRDTLMSRSAPVGSANARGVAALTQKGPLMQKALKMMKRR